MWYLAYLNLGILTLKLIVRDNCSIDILKKEKYQYFEPAFF